MAKFLFDSDRWTTAESWRTIRTVRADPPANLRRMLAGERMVVFQAALEQAQQQFAAAAVIGYESRPLNLFYGLSQAGRALAAASGEIYPKHPDASHQKWESTSHGLDFKPTGGLQEFWNQAVTVKPTDGDTFSRASIALNSPTADVGAVPLGALVSQFPNFTMNWRSFRGWPRAIDDNGSALRGDHPRFAISDYEGGLTVEAMRAEFDVYPALRGLEVQVGEDGIPVRDQNSWVGLLVPAERVIELGPYRQRLKGAGSYVGGSYVFPAAGASDRAFHPIMTWWALLFAFSMLARYHPKRWAEVLDLTTSKYASQIEFVLDAAVHIVPEMLAREMWESPWAD